METGDYVVILGFLGFLGFLAYLAVTKQLQPVVAASPYYVPVPPSLGSK